MNWFKDHVYIASWVFPPIAIIITLLKKKSAGEHVDLILLFAMVLFCICLGISFTPQFDDKSREWAHNLTTLLIGYILVANVYGRRK